MSLKCSSPLKCFLIVLVRLAHKLCTMLVFLHSCFSSVQFFHRLGCWGDRKDDSAETFFQSSAESPCEKFWHWQTSPLFEVVHPAFPLPSTVPYWMVSERLSWRVSCPNHVSFRLLTRCPEGWFRRGCRNVCHARTMQVSVS